MQAHVEEASVGGKSEVRITDEQITVVTCLFTSLVCGNNANCT